MLAGDPVLGVGVVNEADSAIVGSGMCRSEPAWTVSAVVIDRYRTRGLRQVVIPPGRYWYNSFP